jgi:hypothetical protein
MPLPGSRMATVSKPGLGPCSALVAKAVPRGMPCSKQQLGTRPVATQATRARSLTSTTFAATGLLLLAHPSAATAAQVGLTLASP